MNPQNTSANFLTGLVFGFDVGTGSIGYAVRRGNQFLDVGVLICPEDTNDLSGRRGLRRQRRTLRSRKFRRQWFATELEKLGLPRPALPPDDPIALRLRALNGEPLPADQLHAALTHLFKRRGYSKVPWANTEARAKEGEADKEEGVIKEAVAEIARKLGGKHPCQYLAQRHAEVGTSPTEHWARKIYWPREVLRDEFLAILATQAKHFPQLASQLNGLPVADWLLYGDTREVAGFHVFFKTTEARNPGVLGLRWPRFDNRGPALDAFQPVDEQGRPLHVVRKNKESFTQAQWAMALINLRVQDPNTRRKFAPSAAALAKLREVWEKQQAKNAKRKSKKPAEDAESNKEEEITITRAVLKQWAEVCGKELNEHFALIEGQRDLTPKTGAGRARFNSPNLAKLQRRVESGQGMPVLQNILRRQGETNEESLDRYLRDIKHPLVRHRLALFRKLLSDPKDGLIIKFGLPDVVVVEAVRKLAMGDNAKRRLKAWQDAREEDSTAALTFWRERDNAKPQRKALERWKLWRELQVSNDRVSRCPYCLQPIITPADETVEVEHIVPYRRVFCDEFFNKTVAHRSCNAYKGERTPHEAFAQNPADWPVRWKNDSNPDDPDTIVGNARLCFRRQFHFSYQHIAKISGQEVKRSMKDSAVNSKTKLDLFISPNAEALVEDKSEIVQTAYLAKLLRHACLLQIDRPNRRWLKEDGTDPTDEKGNHPAQCYLVTNGSLTSRLRQSWGLNQILHPLPPGRRWDELSEAEQQQFTEKNRGDLRHHAVDAMVIACTLPWLAHRTHGAKDERGNHGWWTQDEKQRSKAANPLFPREGEMHKVCKERIEQVVVRHHASKSRHKAGYETTIYGQAKRTVREGAARTRVSIPGVYIARKDLSKMGAGNFRDVFPSELGVYLSVAWERFGTETPNLSALLKQSKDKLPGTFIEKLCFAHFQSWREAIRRDASTGFSWPSVVRIPIRAVKLVAPANDATVVPFAPGTNGFVKRNTFREVRIYPAADGKGFVPVFVPFWKGDKLIGIENAVPGSRPVAVLRKQDVIQTVKPLSTGHQPGHYCLYELGQVQPYLLPSHIAKKEEALVSFGIKKSGIKPRWPDLIRALGYELPHPPSTQSPPPGAAEA